MCPSVEQKLKSSEHQSTSSEVMASNMPKTKAETKAYSDGQLPCIRFNGNLICSILFCGCFHVKFRFLDTAYMLLKTTLDNLNFSSGQGDFNVTEIIGECSFY